MEEINIKEFLGYLKKYSIIIILMAMLLLSISFIYDVIIKKPEYTTYTSLVLVKDNSIYNYNYNYEYETIDQNDINLNQKLVSTYRQIVKSRLVLEQVTDKLSLKYDAITLAKKVNVEALEDTEILKISVTDQDPEQAVLIANTLANVFETEVSKIYKLDNISVIDKAELPSLPSNNTTIKDIIIAFALAIVGGSLVIFVIFYFDDTLRSLDSFEDEIGLPIIGKVFNDNNNIPLIVDKKPKAVTSESIRSLRTNLQFSAVDSDLKTLLITSTLPSEGKSFVSSNLAISFAQAGKKVLLIDCDLRKGIQHKNFKVANKKGLSNLLVDEVTDYKDYIKKGKVENLSILTRGSFPPNPSELLSSKKMKRLVNYFKDVYDVVILDGAPCSGLSDSIALSSIVDRVLLISRVNYTPKKELKNTKITLEKVGANVAGSVINKIKTKKHGYGKYYYSSEYGYGYGYGEK